MSVSRQLPEPGDRAVDSHWVASWCGVTVHAVRSWRERGMGPPFTKLPNGFVRYKVREVVEWWNQHRKENGS